eukprot:scaffold39194_cov18-Prasinocladus_malaysianus.AAC.1
MNELRLVGPLRKAYASTRHVHASSYPPHVKSGLVQRRRADLLRRRHAGPWGRHPARWRHACE